jgi:hypothetical protein
MRIKSASLTSALALAISLGATQAANSADIAKPVYKAPPPKVAAPSWTGFYVNADGGYGLWTG